MSAASEAVMRLYEDSGPDEAQPVINNAKSNAIKVFFINEFRPFAQSELSDRLFIKQPVSNINYLYHFVKLILLAKIKFFSFLANRFAALALDIP